MDLQNKTKEELLRKVQDNRQKLQAFRFAMTGGKQKNVKEGKGFRKEIAQIFTELQKRVTK